MKKILVAFGTRPEIIKLAPLISELKKTDNQIFLLHTGQHDELAADMLTLFEIDPDVDLKSMRSASNLFELTEFLLPRLEKLLEREKPDLVIVQGDTTSAYLSALAAFYLKIPVHHVEAGLRSFDNYNPFPEELNRKHITGIAEKHYAPTLLAKQNLIKEGIDEEAIVMTGNTVIDALQQVRSSNIYTNKRPEILDQFGDDEKLILVTIHRRENHGNAIHQILNALISILNLNGSAKILIPAHPSLGLHEILRKGDYDHPNLIITEPLDYLSFHHALDKCDLILTDSGGIQEEAAALGKPLLVLRKTTERQELIESGYTTLVGSDSDIIYKKTTELLKVNFDKKAYNPYGDGNASAKIVEVILHY